MGTDIRKFVDLLYAEGLSETSIKHHKNRIRYLLKETNNNLSTESIRIWIGKAKRGETSTSSKVWSNNGINPYIKSVRKYGAVFNIPELHHFKLLPKEEASRATLSTEEIETFLDLPPVFTGSNNRKENIDRYNMFTVFFYIVAHTGCRPSEAAKLTIQDINLGSSVITFNQSKTRSVKLIPISNKLSKVLKSYLSSLNRDEMFHQCSSHNWTKQFKNRLKRLGIKRDGVRPYSLRHSFAQRMIETEGVSVFDVQNLMGHKKVETTMNYYRSSTSRLKKVIGLDPLGIKDLNVEDTFSVIEALLEPYRKDASMQSTVSRDVKKKELIIKLKLK